MAYTWRDGGFAIQLTTAQRNRLILVGGGLLLVLWLLYEARAVLYPFIIGLLAAYLLVPVVDVVERPLRRILPRRRLSRPVAILFIYALAIALLAQGMVALIPDIVGQVTDFLDKAPGYIEGARTTSEEWGQRYRDVAPPAVQERVDQLLDDAASGAGDMAQTAAVRTLEVVTQTFSMIVGFFIIPVWLFYVLRDQDKAVEAYYRLVPDSLRQDAQEVAHIVNNTLGRYVRAQLLLGVFVGSLAGIGLWVLRVDFAVPLGIFAGVFELIPFVGPVLGAIPAVVVAVASDPSKVPLVIGLFIVVQLVENNLLVPQMQGAAVRMNPAVIMLVLVLGGQLWGIWGMVVAVPLVAVCRDLFVYAYRRLGEERNVGGETTEPPQDVAEDVVGVTDAD